jgi:hypothetical protein
VVARKQFWSDLAKDSPFRIEPSHALIPPYASQVCITIIDTIILYIYTNDAHIYDTNALIPPYASQLFTVTLFRTGTLGSQLAQLTGAVVFSDTQEENIGGDEGSVSLSAAGDDLSATSKPSLSGLSGGTVTGGTGGPGGTAGGNKFTLSLLLEGEFIHPTITLGNNTLTADTGMYIYTHTYTYTYTHIHIHILLHTYTHILIHTPHYHSGKQHPHCRYSRYRWYGWYNST